MKVAEAAARYNTNDMPETAASNGYTENNQIVVVVNSAIVRQNAARIADYLAGFGATLTVVTKVVQLSPELIDRGGLGAYALYDTDVRNFVSILRSGARLLCSQVKREQIRPAAIPDNAHVEAYAETVEDLVPVSSGIGVPTIYLDIDEGRDGIRREDYGRLAAAVRAGGHVNISVVCNVRCDADSESPARFFAPLRASLAELNRLGVAVAHISLGGSAVLPYLAQASELPEVPGRKLSVRVGESIFNGAIPHNASQIPELPLQNALSVHLPVLRTRGSNLHLVAGGYPALEQSSIASREITIQRQWSEHTLLECPPAAVGGDRVEIPLTYTGAARLKVHRDVKTVVVE